MYSSTLRHWRYVAVGMAIVLLACTADPNTAPPDPIELAGPLAGKWVFSTSTMPSTNPNVACQLTATLRLDARAVAGTWPPGVVGRFTDAVISCAGVDQALVGSVGDFTSSAADVEFGLTATALSGDCSAQWSGDTMAGTCLIQYTAFGFTQWQGTFTATRVSSNPDP